MNKKLFIFDMGGVMCDNTNVTDDICNTLDIGKSEFIKHCTRDGLKKIQTGEMKMTDFWDNFANNSGLEIKEDYFKLFFKPVRKPEMYELVEELKKNFRVVLGTNTIKPHYEVHMENNDYYVFEKIYPSHLIGFSKPDSDFLMHIVKEEGYEPENVIFIDDTEDNVLSAKNDGINAFIFKNKEKLLEEISEYIK